MKTLIYLTLLVASAALALADEKAQPIEGSPKLTPLHENGGTVEQDGIVMSGDRYGCELAVATDHGTYVFDWFLSGKHVDFEQGATYRFILADDRKSLSEIRNHDGKVVWKTNATFKRPEARLLRIHFADPTLIGG